MLGLVCFMCPGKEPPSSYSIDSNYVQGLFNALNGLGGGGQLNATTSANANSALYSTFAAGAFFAGSVFNHFFAFLICSRTVNNKIGPRLSLLLGSLGYSLYIGSYL